MNFFRTWLRRALNLVGIGKTADSSPPAPIGHNRPPKSKRRTDGGWGEYYYLDDLLDNLDDYFETIRVLRRMHPDVYDLYSLAGAQSFNAKEGLVALRSPTAREVAIRRTASLRRRPCQLCGRGGLLLCLLPEDPASRACPGREGRPLRDHAAVAGQGRSERAQILRSVLGRCSGGRNGQTTEGLCCSEGWNPLPPMGVPRMHPGHVQGSQREGGRRRRAHD